MPRVVITGSTRGIGFGLAEAFLSRGCAVHVSGRSQAGVDEARAQLAARHGAEHVSGCACDVTDFGEVQQLWDEATARMGSVDIWINNAGIGHARHDFWNQDAEEMAAVIETNVIGTMYGAKVALSGMLKQGFGALYNMEGLGSDGRRVAGLSAYGSSKSAVRYLTGSLAKEVAGTPVIVGALSPGMVTTEFLTGHYEMDSEEWQRAKRIFNILADHAETVTPWLAEKVLGNTRNGARFEWLTGPKSAMRFAAAPFRRRELFGD